MVLGSSQGVLKHEDQEAVKPGSVSKVTAELIQKGCYGSTTTHSHRAAVYRMWCRKLGAHYDLEISYHCCTLQRDVILSDP